MKITIAYIHDEQETVTTTVAALRRIYPGIRVRESDRNAPFKHVYLTTRKPKNVVNPTNMVDISPGVWYNCSKEIGMSTAREG